MTQCNTENESSSGVGAPQKTGDVDPWSMLTGLVFGALFLLVLDFGWTYVTGLYANVHVSVPFYLAGAAMLVFGLWLMHALPVWGIYRFGQRFIAAPQVLLPGLAAIFGVSVQRTLVVGDGISAHPMFLAIRIGFLIGFPLIFALGTWLLVTPRIPLHWRRAMAAIALVVGVIFNLTVYIDYQRFHGHLAAYNAAIFVGLSMPIWRRTAVRMAAVAVVVCVAVATAFVLPDQERARTHVQRFSHIPASLGNGLPLGSLIQVEPEKLFVVQDSSSEKLQEYYDTVFGHQDKFEKTERRGDHVLFIVLESVRADYWDDPELTPRFHEWKQHGVHVPRGVANYPATPLAYGAMFTAHPPSVVAQTPYWGEDRLFDELKEEFDHLFLSQPDISWFEHTAITDFFLPRDRSVHAHEEGPDGLNYLRDSISEVDEGDTFFSWVHLYEPHDPYEARQPWVDDPSDDRDRYRSEIAYTDHHLGEFMDWFFKQPVSDDTLVVLVADHGQGMGETIMGEEFWGHHVHVHNVVTDVPMFFAGPGLPDEKREEDVGVMQLDVMPTLYDFTGTALPREAMPQGNSFYHLLEQRPTRPMVSEAFSIRGGQFFDFVASAQRGDDVEDLREEFHRISTDGQRYSPKIGLQYGDYKIIYDRLLQKSWVYNIADDPEETQNLYEKDPQQAEKMEVKLQTWNELQGEVVRQLDELLVEE